MKNHIGQNVLNLTLILLILSLCFSNIVCAQNPEEPETYPSTYVYEYPIKPGTDEWKYFTSYDQKAQACQIPPEILAKISTEGLIETVLNYPLLNGFRAHDDIHQGFERVTKTFNGLRELLIRQDAGSKLIQKYRSIDLDSVDERWTDVEKGYFAWGIQNIEMILMQESIINGLTNQQCYDLINVASLKAQAMKNNPYVYGDQSVLINALLIELVSKRFYSERATLSSITTPEDSSVEVFLMNPATDELTQGEIAAINN